MSSSVKRSVTVSLAAVVGLAPFAIDMYLPSLPVIASEFRSPAWVTQITLTGYMVVLGLGQLVAGPVTDALGRRRPLLFGLALFTAGSAAAIFAPSMGVLIVARLLQGIGGATALVVANSSVRDHSSGDAATRLYAVLLTVSALAPIIAPSVGGVLSDSFGWRGVFVVLAGIGVVVTIAAFLLLSESLPLRSRRRERAGAVLSSYSKLLENRAFVVPLIGFAAVFMVLFSYIGGAAYVYQNAYGLDASTFGFVFGATGIALLIGAGIANRLSAETGTRTLAVSGVVTLAVGTLLSASVLALGGPLSGVVAGMALVAVGIGLSEPALMSICMSPVDTQLAGSAAAVLGASQYLLGGVATIVAGSIASESPAGWGLMMFIIGALGALIVALGARRVDASIAVSH